MSVPTHRFFVVAACLLLTGTALEIAAGGNVSTEPVANPAADATEHLSFTRDVRPLLSKHCYACHGPDEEQREAGLRLDLADEADWDEVIARITATDPDEMMPPPRANKALGEADRDTLRRWIDDGSEYEPHWAFVPPKKPPVPDAAHPVDFWIDRRLAREATQRSSPADAMTRLRRVHLDLIGLPPTPEQTAAFAADPSTQHYQRIVDSLLQSPRYGERWARRWLDLARYADTNGYEKDRDRPIWPYRDWVIRAINTGMPFDQFTIAQLAGDMLPGADADQHVATGFHRNTMLNEEGGIDPLEFRFHAMTDRVATTGTTWLGLTTGCAQCHTHKYDPITHHDYFGMMAYLNNVEEPNYFIRTEASLARLKKQHAEADSILQDLASHWSMAIEKQTPQQTAEQTKRKEAEPESAPEPDDRETFDDAIASWWNNEQQKFADWSTIVPQSMQTESMSIGRPYLIQEADGVILAAGDTTKHDVYVLTFPASDQPITSIRLEALPDERLPGFGPGLTFYEGRRGDFFLSEFHVEVLSPDVLQFDVLQSEESPGQPKRVPIRNASHTYSRNAFGNQQGSAALAVDGDLQTGWSVADRSAMRNVAVFELEQPIPAQTPFRLQLHFGRHFASSLGKFRLSVTGDENSPQASLIDDATASDREAASTRLDPDVREAFLLQSDVLAELAKRYVRLRQTKPGTPTLVMRERPEQQTRETFLHHRGEYTQAKDAVPPKLPDAVMTPGATLPEDRLGFARWLVSRENPLTARVVANRAWAAFFGTGIVSTVDDFGMQGELPMHPELLDFLAVELMDKGWSIKNLHRLIVTSQTYQQSSAIDPREEHPMAERLLSRFPRTRLEAEIIRDASLAAAGLLENKMYGPPVRPPQPEAARSANYSKSSWRASEGVDRYRRSVYTYQQRTAPFAMFTTFDASSGEACVARRDVSNTPLQSLTLMNDPMFLEIAEAYGKSMAAFEGETHEKITSGFRKLLTRAPSETELQMLAAFHDRNDDWTALARILLCLDESITKN